MAEAGHGVEPWEHGTRIVNLCTSSLQYGSDSGPLFVTRIKKLNKAHEQLRVAAGMNLIIIQVIKLQ